MCRVKRLPLAMAAVLASVLSLAGARSDRGASTAGAAPSGLAATSFALNSSTGQASDATGATGDLSLIPEIRFPASTTTTTTTEPRPTTTTTPPMPVTEPPPPPPPPSFVCPVQGDVSFVDSWGWPRSGGRTHQGVDMMAASGTPTVAPVSGRVEHGDSGLGGQSWHLYGDDGDVYYGAHLSSYENVGVGWVAAGTVIGYVGDSGNAAGTPHLHFELHPGGGEATNPYPEVAEAC